MIKSIAKYTLLVVCTVSMLAATLLDRDDYFEITRNIEIFVNVFKELNYNYVDDIDPGELMRIGIDAMVGSLDPYTNFISESQIERYRLNDDKKFEGMGAEMGLVDSIFTVLEPYEDSPALAAGLQAGDQILSIDGRSTVGKSLEEILRIARGAPGTAMDLSVQRYGEPSPMSLSLTRGDVQMPNVPYSGIVKDNVGYIKLTTFTAGASLNIANALKALKKEDPDLKGFVLDLRQNGGGLLSEAVDISSIWIPQGEIVVTTKGKVKDRDQVFKTRKTPLDLNIPIAVLIDERSASASEIVSGVIQDYDRGVLLGQRSFGKGLVQNQQEVGYNNRVKFTTSKYYIPSRRCIQSKEYKDGKPVDIPQDQRSPFKTRNGRVVYDGGGVAPDIALPKVEKSELLAALEEDNIIHKYVTKYTATRDSIAPAGEYRFDDYQDFVAYVQGLDWDYKTTAEDLLQQLVESGGDDITANVKALEASLQSTKAAAYTTHKEEIRKTIEQDIVSRYYYQSGKAHQNLNGDSEVLAAIELINDPERYQAILKAQ